MKPFAAFVKMQLNVNYGVSALKYRFTREKKKLWEPILLAVVIPVALLPMLILYTFMMTGVFAAGAALNQPEIILTISFLFAQLVILFFGLFYIIGTFFYSQDLESLVPLPLRPYEVVGGKFAVILVNEYLTGFPILLPPLIIYGVGTGQGVVYWIKALVLLLITPALPLAVAAIFIMILMRFINFGRHKDLLTIIGGLSAFVLAMGLNVFIQSVPKTNTQDFLNNILQQKSGLIELIGSRFPPSIWATRGLSEQTLAGAGYFLLFIAVCILLFLLLLWLANMVFYQSLLSGQEVSRKRKAMTETELEKQYGKSSGAVMAMMKRDWKLVYRTPVYAINGLTGSIIGPIIIMVMFFAKGKDKGTIQLFDFINKPEAAPYVLLGGLGLMLFTGGMNLVASTALSREGQTFWITKLIPVSARQQVTAKLILSCLVSTLGIAVTGIIMLLFFKLSPLMVLAAIFIGLLGAVPMAALNLMLDIFHPKLVWNSEQEAMKQNMNASLGILLSLGVMLILGAVTFVMLILKMSMVLTLAAIGVVSVILGILSIIALYAVAERKYRELEA